MLSSPKFRIWSKHQHKMFYPNWISFFPEGRFEASCNEDLVKIRHIPLGYKRGDAFIDSCTYYEVQVCTNNKDKNGIYIWEGDILKFSEDGFIVVRYDEPEMGYNVCRFLNLNHLLFEDMEVVGNMYENSEELSNILDKKLKENKL
jgi:hypothetical protein